jgi:hypothetical protein
MDLQHVKGKFYYSKYLYSSPTCDIESRLILAVHYREDKLFPVNLDKQIGVSYPVHCQQLGAVPPAVSG